MTCAELIEGALRRVGEDPAAPVFYTATEALNALNEGQRVFCLLTWCLETTGALALTAATSHYHLLSTFPDLMVVLRTRVSNTGARLEPGRIEDFDAFNSAWLGTAGDPTLYQVLGLDLMLVTPRPAADGRSLEITYARTPTRMTGTAVTPEIPAEYHPLLEDYAVYRMRTPKEAGQEGAKTLDLWGNFQEEAAKYADYVRMRMAADGYDRLPPELRG